MFNRLRQTDVHANGEIRVKVRKLKLKLLESMCVIQGSLCNSESFAKDFDCPKDSAMNPLKKCKVFFLSLKIENSWKAQFVQVW